MYLEIMIKMTILSINKISNEILAYSAGIVDGEGCILVEDYKYKNGDRAFILVLKVVNTDKRVIDYLYNSLGGHICNERKATKNRRRTFRWYMKGKEAANMIKLLLPFMIIKKEQALIALDFRKTFDIKYSSRKQIPLNIIKFREECYKNLQELKTRTFDPY